MVKKSPFFVFVLILSSFLIFSSFSYAFAQTASITATVTTTVPPSPIETKVVFQGKAYPGAEITILKDGQVAVIIPAGPQADFKTELSGLTPGTYTFGLWAEDKAGRRSTTYSFTVYISYGTITTVSGIFLSPTIELEKEEIEQGELLNISGQTAPISKVNIHINSEEEIIEETRADQAGDWFYALGTKTLAKGAHTIKVRAISTEDLLSSFSQVLEFTLKEKATTPPQIEPTPCDLNGDDKVNLVDFSILLYWWGRNNPDVDANDDGIINLTDFSIMLYYWTG